VARGQPRGAGAVVAVVGLEQRADAAGQLAADLALPRLHLGHVEADVVGQDADVRAVAELVVVLRGVDQRLRWDTADVQADPAGLVALDHQRLLLELAETDSGDIASWAAANDQRLDANRFLSHRTVLDLVTS